jgi:DNA (cytosine-5)-methyltransferase 1
MKYFSMYSGICGFEKGIEDAEVDWECVGRSEIDKYAEAIARYHYPNVKNYGDATRIIPEELPDFDCIVGGFPCQSFSIAGKRRGFEDTRGTLFFEVLRIARVKRPNYLWLENVKGLLNHEQGDTFQIIIESLDELGYDCQWQVLNSKYHGVPQNRERVFIIANLRGISRPKVFPIRKTSSNIQIDRTESNREGKRFSFSAVTTRAGGRVDDNFVCVNALDAHYHKGFDNYGHRTFIQTNVPQSQRIREINGVASTLQGLAGGQGGKTGLYNLGNDRIRRLTPIECERLQGYPDGWTKYGLFEDGKIKEISDTQRYKCCGNAVTTNVIKDIVLKWSNVTNG